MNSAAVNVLAHALGAHMQHKHSFLLGTPPGGEFPAAFLGSPLPPFSILLQRKGLSGSERWDLFKMNVLSQMGSNPDIRVLVCPLSPGASQLNKVRQRLSYLGEYPKTYYGPFLPVGNFAG